MGIAKQAWIESEERGWDAPDNFVCPDCVQDSFLKSIIEIDAVNLQCDFCGADSENPIAAPVESLMPFIAGAVCQYYSEPYEAGLPFGMEYEELFTHDVLAGVGLDCHDDLFESIADSFHNHIWISSAHGHWLGDHNSTSWMWDWKHFEQRVKHSTRYFFSAVEGEDENPYSDYVHPEALLSKIGSIADDLELFTSLPVGTELFRVRENSNKEKIDTFDLIGPPPPELAGAGRMNPAGISYFYLAQDKSTALGEILGHLPMQLALGTFKVKHELRVMDLTLLPVPFSIFDFESYELNQSIYFLQEFIEEISKPVSKDGREHIDYVPTQVVSEYFAQVFKIDDDVSVDGIVYPSTKVKGGKNLVAFPKAGIREQSWEDRFGLDGIEDVVLNNWDEMIEAFS